MASIFIGVNRGTNDMSFNSVTEGASTGATDFEFRIDTGKGSDRFDAIRALRLIERYLEGGGMGINTAFVE